MNKNTKTLRLVIPLAVLFVVSFGFAAHLGFGTISAFGWQEIALLCPLGALETLLASKLLVPRVIIALAIAIILIILVGRLFCGWICPVPVVSKLRSIFGGKPTENEANGLVDTPITSTDGKVIEPLTASEKKELERSGCGSSSCNDPKHSCSTCAENRESLKSRYFILGSALLSAGIFGFPVFCLVCPIGLTFGTILLVMRMFSGGDMTWAIIVVPLLLVIEVVFFRKWCHTFCPIGAFMSIIGRLNRTFRPSIDDSKCLETARGAHCGRCAEVCPEAINPRHPELGANMCECTRCRACVDVCPAHAISMPFLPIKRNGDTVVLEDPEKTAS